MTANCRSKNTADRLIALALGLTMCGAFAARSVSAQTTAISTAAAAAAKPAATADIPGAVTPPPGYVIGVDDKLGIVYWKDKDMSAEVIVRPDGRISLPLLNEVNAAGLTPLQLHDALVTESRRYVEDANITVVVLQINSRRVFITGEIAKPGPYQLGGPTTVLQLIAMAGCFQGLQVQGNAEEVGLRTTVAVVQGIFLVIVLDAFFAVFFTEIGWT